MVGGSHAAITLHQSIREPDMRDDHDWHDERDQQAQRKTQHGSQRCWIRQGRSNGSRHDQEKVRRSDSIPHQAGLASPTGVGRATGGRWAAARVGPRGTATGSASWKITEVALHSPDPKDCGHEYAHEERDSAHPPDRAQKTEDKCRYKERKPKPSLEVSQRKAHGAMSPYALLRRLDQASFHQHSRAPSGAGKRLISAADRRRRSDDTDIVRSTNGVARAAGGPSAAASC